MLKQNLFFIKKNNGFTLLEMMIAILLSSIVILGAYMLIVSIANIEHSIAKNRNNTAIICRLSSLINQDFRESIIDTLNYNNGKLEFTTYHSLFFNNAIPVKVQYYIYNNYLVRSEFRKDINYYRTIYLLQNSKNIKFMFWHNHSYHNNLTNPCYLIKVTFNYINQPITIVLARFKY